eukprot:CAMPEP_0185705366 /NCGR_PEP_ID=MMETSP1164-20130828/19671_1 /TAXON_ID=1104430 /ORGANISM="Chrysoreinhardia sp, Strain CCMP2950" /LENGTH=96 /DNA_ID=CAMNT_0028372749 /DNA_START=110 /DNA_END=397 /DNA_ORIENTATION=-
MARTRLPQMNWREMAKKNSDEKSGTKKSRPRMVMGDVQRTVTVVSAASGDDEARLVVVGRAAENEEGAATGGASRQSKTTTGWFALLAPRDTDDDS